ncbi:hypothetical protein D2V08_01585 [Flagellimonas lutimaris]|uniref:Uncharacterized protein n=1 Tax=Flagellimonas lutimaris TaxID=475082 RepID=A0A3A1NER3_9FLAO|nr:hypothetical protein D2V08_01585 [Allomuricauda lutimaris]
MLEVLDLCAQHFHLMFCQIRKSYFQKLIEGRVHIDAASPKESGQRQPSEMDKRGHVRVPLYFLLVSGVWLLYNNLKTLDL